MKLRRFMSSMIIVAMIASLFAAFAVTTTAAETVDPNGVYATLMGAGKKDGSSWENALAAGSEGGLQAAWDKTAENGTLYLAGGEYGFQKLSIKPENDGKSLTEFKKLVGVDKGTGVPVFTGTWTREVEGKDTFAGIATGASYVWFENIKITCYQNGFKTNGNTEGLRAYNVEFLNTTDGFYLEGGAGKDPNSRVKDIIIDSCKSTNFKKSFSRMRNGICDVIVSNCVADAGGKDFWESDNFPMAFQITGNTEGVFEERLTFVDCVAMNTYHEKGVDGYWNSDGFNSERNARDFTYIRCRAYNSTDGGWDCKGWNPTLIDCISMQNKRNYRFWSQGQVTLVNCLAAYGKTQGGIGSDCGFGIFGGPKATEDTKGNGYAALYNCTFYNNYGTQILTEGGRADLYNCIVGVDDDAVLNYNREADNVIWYSHPEYKNNSVNLNNSIVYVKGQSDESLNPKFKNASSKWFDGKSDDWNSTTFGNKFGYYYDAEKPAAIAPATSIGYGIVADVPAAYDWAKDSIAFMIEKGFMPGRAVMGGFNEGGPSNFVTAFAPSYDMSRGEFASMLVRTLGITATAGGNFSDVAETYLFANDIAVAKAAGVVKGNDNDGTITFNPYNSITREEVMVMLSRAMKLAGKLDNSYSAALSVLDTFSDKDSIAGWAQQEVANMVEKAIIKGNDNGTINPQGNTTRAEGAAIGKRVFDLK